MGEGHNASTSASPSKLGILLSAASNRGQPILLQEPLFATNNCVRIRRAWEKCSEGPSAHIAIFISVSRRTWQGVPPGTVGIGNRFYQFMSINRNSTVGTGISVCCRSREGAAAGRIRCVVGITGNEVVNVAVT